MADQTPDVGGNAGDEPSDPQNKRGMQRKLFTEPFGPQEL